jgi:integrase
MKRAGHPITLTHRISDGERKKQQRKQLRRWFNEEDIARCLAYTFPNSTPKNALLYRVIIMLLHDTGARVREIARIEAEHVDIEGRTVWLMESKSEPRAAFFSPTTQVMIENLKHARRRRNWRGRIFPDAPRITQVVMEMLEDLGLKKPRDGRGPHTFRHYLATRLFYGGNMRIEDIAFLLEDTTDTIVNNYLHPTPRMLRERVSRAMEWEEGKEVLSFAPKIIKEFRIDIPNFEV